LSFGQPNCVRENLKGDHQFFLVRFSSLCSRVRCSVGGLEPHNQSDRINHWIRAITPRFRGLSELPHTFACFSALSLPCCTGSTPLLLTFVLLFSYFKHPTDVFSAAGVLGVSALLPPPVTLLSLHAPLYSLRLAPSFGVRRRRHTLLHSIQWLSSFPCTPVSLFC